jgi:ribonuclease III
MNTAIENTVSPEQVFSPDSPNQDKYPFKRNSDLSIVEGIINYEFTNKLLLQHALVHRSYTNEKDKDPAITEHNERLEFLGDAVLELVVSDYLFNELSEPEGKMTKLRSALVKDSASAALGIKLGLDNEILLSRGEREELGKARPSIVANAVEAIIGAIYLDGGIEPAKEFILNNIMTQLPDIISNDLFNDYKTLMQEFTQKYTKITPHYKVISTEGKDHDKIYICGIWIDNEKIAEGVGKSKQIAETEAAKKGYEIMQARYN